MALEQRFRADLLSGGKICTVDKPALQPACLRVVNHATKLTKVAGVIVRKWRRRRFSRRPEHHHVEANVSQELKHVGEILVLPAFDRKRIIELPASVQIAAATAKSLR